MCHCSVWLFSSFCYLLRKCLGPHWRYCFEQLQVKGYLKLFPASVQLISTMSASTSDMFEPSNDTYSIQFSIQLEWQVVSSYTRWVGIFTSKYTNIVHSVTYMYNSGCR